MRGGRAKVSLNETELARRTRRSEEERHSNEHVASLLVEETEEQATCRLGHLDGRGTNLGFSGQQNAVIWVF